MSEIAPGDFSWIAPLNPLRELQERIAVLEKCIEEQHEINETMINTIEIILDTLKMDGH